MTRAIAIDTEWGYRDGRLGHVSEFEPVILCAVDGSTGERPHFWRRDPTLVDWLHQRSDATFVCHYMPAEVGYLLRVGAPIPENWFCTLTAYKWLINRSGKDVKAGLSDALHGVGLPRLAPAEKKALQQRILNLDFDWDSESDLAEIRDYCFSDCDGTLGLYREIAAKVPVPQMHLWTEFLKVTAKIELRGVGFDLVAYERLLERWPRIREQLMDKVNHTCPIYEKGVEKRARFLNWAVEQGIDWPCKTSPATGQPYYPLDDDTLKDFENRHPFIAEYRHTRKTLKAMNSRTLAVDGNRHYFNTPAFRSVTGRSQMTESVFISPKWMRWLVVPDDSDHVLVYVDYTAQEIAIAAALSGDESMRQMYDSADAHLGFAKMAGQVPWNATKATHPDARRRSKTVSLGVLYGQTSFGMAKRLGVAQEAAQGLVRDHRRLFGKFWAWSESTVDAAYERGWIETPNGWRARVLPDSNERTWMNYMMQASGADIMRNTAIYLDQQNVRVLAVIHDGFLLSCARERLRDLKTAVNHACRLAVDDVLGEFPMRWDFAVFEDRFRDDDGRPMWRRLMELIDG